MKYPAKDKIDVGQMVLDAPDGLDLFGATNAGEAPASASSSRFKSPPSLPDFQGMALNHAIGDIARNSFIDQREQDFFGKTVPPLFSRLRFILSG